MARELSLEEYIPELSCEKEHLKSVINDTLWDEKDGFYYDRYKDGRLNGVRHIGAFWSLIAECAPKDRAERMIERLLDEREFNTPFPVPALSKSHPDYSNDGGYWCGGVWAPTTYTVLKGLDNYNRSSLAHSIAKKHLDAVVEVFERENTLFENYAPEKFDGKFREGSPAKRDFVGWAGLSPIAILFEYVFGIKPFASENKIVWQVELLERHGVERYPFGTDGELTLLCHERNDKTQEPTIEIKSNVPVQIEVLWGDGNKKTLKIQP
jgi:glycogen debranching enzyme